MSLTLIADSNISHLHDYFNANILGVPVKVMEMAGRDITAEVLATEQPQALLIRSVTPVNESLLANNTSVQFVGSATIGTDHIDQGYLASRNISFSNASGCSKHSVAQYVLTAILSLQAKHNDKDSQANDQTNNRTRNKAFTLGIIGLGNIGSTLASYGTAMGWQILGYDPLLKESELNENKFNNASFQQLISQADAISLHVPLTTTTESNYPTYHLIDKNAFSQMKATALLINSARGQVVQESALLADIAVTGRQVVLDVFEHEPVVSAQLLDKLAITTPHIAGYTLEGKLRGTQMIYQAFCQQFGLVIRQSLENLLPNNPYCWQDLHAKLLNEDGALANYDCALSDYYDIEKDDALLKQSINPQTGQVEAKVFDALRKNYQLRREWHY